MAGPATRLWWTAFTALQLRGEERLPFTPLETVLARQARKVRRIVRHAYESVPHYRGAMDAAGLRPADIRTAEDLARLPLISGDELAADPERFVSRRYPRKRTVSLRSSGTGGRPKVVRYSRGSLFTALAHGQRQRVVLAHFVGRRHGYREMIAQRSQSVSFQLRRFYEAHSWVPRGVELQRAELPLEAGLADAVRRLNRFRPEVLFGYGSYIGALFRRAWEEDLQIHRPRVVWYGADHMVDADRELLEGELGVPVVSTYQADEALRIGFQCELRAGFHLSLDDVAVRVVDGGGRPVRPGETGEVVLSNLTNRATVLLNYRLGDRATPGRAVCPCGRTLPTLERIDGRADDLLRLPGGESLHPSAAIQRLQEIPGVVRVQLVQEELAKVVARVVTASGAGWVPLQARVTDGLQTLLGPSVDVAVERVRGIDPEPGGKVRAVISRCGGGP